MFHRKPPKPIAYDKVSPGNCRYCGEVILDPQGKVRKRASWHDDCLEEYKTIYWPGHTRTVVWQRDRGQCAICPTKAESINGDWHVDHRKPLYEAKGDISYWRLDNLDTLCVSCHQKKSANEARARAADRRGAKKRDIV